MHWNRRGPAIYSFFVILSISFVLFLVSAQARDLGVQTSQGEAILIPKSIPDSMCQEPMIAQDIFPEYNPIPGEPTIPPLPNQELPSCRHYSFEWCKEFKKLNLDVKCNILLFGSEDYRHSINSYEFTDSTGQRWVCFAEPQPQTNPQNQPYYEHYCVKAETIESYGGLNKWIKDVLCKQHYQFPSLNCDAGPIKYYQICAQQYGQACSPLQQGQETLCVLNPGNEEEYGPFNINKLKCKCGLFGTGPDGSQWKRCSWQ